MRFKLQAVHIPSQEVISYGPWDADPDPNKQAIQLSFAQGFICGFHSYQTEGQGKPEDLGQFTVVQLPDEEPEEQGASLAAAFKIHDAEMTVTHPDGTTD